MEEVSSNKRIVKNTMFLYIRMIVVLFVTLYTSRLILDILGVEDYGVYNVVSGIVTIFAIVNGALSSGSSRFITYALGKGDFEGLRKTFSASFVIHSAMAVIVFILAETIGLWYVNNILVVPEGRLVAANWLYQFSIVSCMLSLTQVPYGAAIVAHERMGVYAWVGVAEAVFKLIIVWLLMFTENVDKLIMNGALLMFWSVGNQLYYRYYCIRNFKECSLIVVREKSYYKSMLSFSLWDVMGSLCVTGYAQGINLIINLFFGVAINAARGVAIQVENAVARFTENFMTAVNPQIVKLYAAGDYDKMFSLVNASSKYSFILFFMLNLPVFLKADYLLNIWLKEVPEYTTILLQCMIVSRLARSAARPAIQAVHATGNIKYLNLYAGGVSIALNLPLTWTLYSFGYPPQACYYVSFFVGILCNYLELFMLRKQIPSFSIMRYSKEVFGVSLLVCTLVTAVVMIVDRLTSDMGFLSLVLVSLASLVACCVFTFYIATDAETRIKIIAFARNKIQRK